MIEKNNQVFGLYSPLSMCQDVVPQYTRVLWNKIKQLLKIIILLSNRNEQLTRNDDGENIYIYIYIYICILIHLIFI